MNKKKKSGLLGVMQIIIYLAVGVCLGISVYFDMPEISGFIDVYLLLLLVVFGTLYVHVILHELGHLIFGLISGYKFSSFRISSLTFVKDESGKVRVRLMRVPGTSGQCLLEPPEPVDGKIPQVLYNMGGVIMNSVLAVIVLVLKFVLGVSGILGLVLTSFSLIGVALAITNGVPMKNKLICNDGMNALMIHKDPKANRAFYNTLKLAWYQSHGYRMKDMPDELFLFPDSEGMKNSIIASEAVFAIERAMDFGAFDDASEMIETVLNDGEAVNGIYMRLLKSDRLYLSLMSGKPVEYIEMLLDKEMRKLLKTLPYAMFGIYTAYAHEKLYVGDLAKAEKMRTVFEKKSASYPYKGEVETAIELMNRVDLQWNYWHGVTEIPNEF